MRNPDLRELLVGSTTRFSLVTATAKRARDLVDAALAEKEPIMEDKPVSLALDDLLEHKYRIVESEEVRDT
ncbi:MAG: DNA-directed RNA polymerase subunit omega [Oscillospiraceae bacterium]|jgi:DNA-directed RNA polymerase omega subunit|nr:DNA-directed RNA polymerase subunit omega [Oscillospiraceae bacterium]